MKAAQSTYVHEYSPHSPDSPWSSDSTLFHYPDSSFIVSRSPDGAEATYFRENNWKLYSTNELTRRMDRILFDQKPSDNGDINLIQMKSIFLALTRHSYKSVGVPLSPSGLIPYAYLLKKLRIYAERKKTTIYRLLSSTAHTKEIYDKHIPAYRKAHLQQLLFKLSVLPFRYVGFKPALVALESYDDTRPKSEQTTVIPTAIYLQLINTFTSTLTEFNDHLSKAVEFSHRAAENPKYGRTQHNPGAFERSAEEYGLTQYFKKWEITSLKEFAHHLGTIQYCCIMLIYVFTGMRRSEAYSLKFGSLEHIYDKDGKTVKRRFLHGVTSKLKNHPTPTKWTTSVDIELPYFIATTVASIIYEFHGHATKDQPIFISISYLPFCTHGVDKESLSTPEPVWGNYFPPQYHRNLRMPLISESDIIELESMAPGRAWRALAEFSVGQPWPLTIHQIRRSTAIYAIRSGIVSLPALKHILHHITIEMSLYYARGSSFARDLLKESSNSKSAFVHVYQSAELQVRAWQYANEFILTDEVLHGPHGLWLKGKAKDSSKTIPYAELLEDTLKRMKRGELHYQPTPVGGCTSGEVCHKRISVNFLGCDGCKSAAIKPSKVLKLIEVQKVLVSHCDVDSPERNAENQTLFELTEFAQTMGISA
ncbi:hypothetical protein [Pseudomonas monteilii]|uniref:hypothetical protein n=1 Tax=Pseudomonas monteilii TaxID=76759 RepID=UPI001F274FC2|nr:hypothetical protein [Pseudomonas monteilii]